MGGQESLVSKIRFTAHVPWEEQNPTLSTRKLRIFGHKKLESTVRYLGIEVDDALEIFESIEV